MIYSKILEMMTLFREVDEEVGGIVCVDGDGVWGNGMLGIQLSKADAFVEIAGMLGKTIDIIETTWSGTTTIRGEFVADGIAFRNYPNEAEVNGFREYNRAVIEDRKEEFKKEMKE